MISPEFYEPFAVIYLKVSLVLACLACLYLIVTTISKSRFGQAKDCTLCQFRHHRLERLLRKGVGPCDHEWREVQGEGIWVTYCCQKCDCAQRRSKWTTVRDPSSYERERWARILRDVSNTEREEAEKYLDKDDKAMYHFRLGSANACSVVAKALDKNDPALLKE